METAVVHLDEQETVISYYPKSYDAWADYYSSTPHEIKRIKKYAKESPDFVKIIKEDKFGIMAKVHSSWIVGVKPPPKKRGKSLAEQTA